MEYQTKTQNKNIDFNDLFDSLSRQNEAAVNEILIPHRKLAPLEASAELFKTMPLGKKKNLNGYPDDGFLHLDRGILWASGLTGVEFISVPLVLLAGVIWFVASWLITGLLTSQVESGGISVLVKIFAWGLFAAMIAVGNLFILRFTELVWGLIQTTQEGKNNDQY